MSKVCVAGVGMIPFAKPGASEAYHAMGPADCVLALGFEQMKSASAAPSWSRCLARLDRRAVRRESSA